MSGQQPPPPPDPERAQHAFGAFLKAHETLTQMLAKHAELMGALEAVIGDEKDGLITAIDDLTEEMAQHRQEMKLLRGALAGVKVNVDVLDAIEQMTGGRRRR